MDIGCFEILYLPGQTQRLPEPFQGFDVSDINEAPYRELQAFHRFAKERAWNRHEYSGLFSPRFLAKTGLTSQAFVRFMREHPGHDIYLFHPFPRELSIANHFLELAEMEHPGITAGLDYVWSQVMECRRPDILLPEDAIHCCHCNYFVASKRFWSEYGRFVERFMELLNSRDDGPLHALTPYTLSKADEQQLPLAVFVFERSLSLFLKHHDHRWATVNLAYTPDARWSPPELFPGEDPYVAHLGAEISNGSENAAELQLRRRAAVHTYYQHRKELFKRG